jgi:hypothetical protein
MSAEMEEMVMPQQRRSQVAESVRVGEAAMVAGQAAKTA